MRKRKLKVQPLALLFLLWMLISDRSGVGVMTVLAALLHESGHMLAAKCLHIPLRHLRMDLLGARLEVCGRMLSYSEEWLLCAAGPFSSLCFAALASPLWKISSLAIAFSCASVLLGALNLLPIRTFDGGRMLECFLSMFSGPRTVRRVMLCCSFMFLFLLWAVAVYFLLRAGDGLSLFFFSMSLFSRFFEKEVKTEFILS
ncbi:MAG: site-2 protease family protein [Clostridia bacterium]|nr:site-2 protease family protein [Clostridia bacterium]